MEEDPFEIRIGTYYALCWVCQGGNTINLKDPNRSLNLGHALSTYQTAEKNLLNFINNNILLPHGLKVQHIDDGSGIANTLMKNKAVHHDKCRVLLLPKKVERKLKKIKQPESTEP